jgi:hypothetical protein
MNYFLKSRGGPCQAPAAIFPALFKHAKRKNRSVADALEHDHWISDVMHNITPALFADYVLLWILVDQPGFNHLEQEDDQIIWTRTANGVYSAKSAYLMQFDGSLESIFPAKVWHVWAPSRCKFFIWLMLQNRIWTTDRLFLRGWPNQYFCPLCRRNLETVHHLFKECSVSQQVWTEIGIWIAIPSFHLHGWDPNQEVSEWFSGLSGSFISIRSKGVRSLIILVCWSLWRERNAQSFFKEKRSTHKDWFLR